MKQLQILHHVRDILYKTALSSGKVEACSLKNNLLLPFLFLLAVTGNGPLIGTWERKLIQKLLEFLMPKLLMFPQISKGLYLSRAYVFHTVIFPTPNDWLLLIRSTQSCFLALRLCQLSFTHYAKLWSSKFHSFVWTISSSSLPAISKWLLQRRNTRPKQGEKLLLLKIWVFFFYDCFEFW